MEDRREITLRPMTRALCHALYAGWENDPALYEDESKMQPYRYDSAAVDRYFDEKSRDPKRIYLAVMRDGEPIGEVHLKYIDYDQRECALGIALQNGGVKGRGYGARAERLALAYAFGELGMKAVNADALIKNTRSQHVLEKVGFRFVGADDRFRYYRCEKTAAP